ncbi:MAG: hypothetical protein LUH82_04555 [Clostridiales bacterium]|nr:hypothetical protein [Clostridiales bacterium]
MENEFDWIEDCYQCYNEDNWVSKRKYRKAVVVKGDHDHCLIDAKRLSRLDYSDCDKQGYCSSDGVIWLCEACYNEIAKRHKLSLIKNTVEAVESALLQAKTVIFSLKNEQYIINNNDHKIIVEHNGSVKEYDSILTMKRQQMFFGKYLRDIIDELFVGII